MGIYPGLQDSRHERDQIRGPEQFLNVRAFVANVKQFPANLTAEGRTLAGDNSVVFFLAGRAELRYCPLSGSPRAATQLSWESVR